MIVIQNPQRNKTRKTLGNHIRFGFHAFCSAAQRRHALDLVEIPDRATRTITPNAITTPSASTAGTAPDRC